MSISTLIVEQIVSRSLKKIALRTAQRKVGVNKAMSLVRRFDKQKTFMENFRDHPWEQIWKMTKTFAIRKFYAYVLPAKFIHNMLKYGIQECMKRLILRYTPTDLKKPYYFIKNCKSQYERVELMTLGKTTFWSELSKLGVKEQAKTLNYIVKFNPTDKELREYWDFVLDKQFTFIANSPMTGNFEQLHMTYNITEQHLIIPIRGWAGKQIRSYDFYNVEWELVFLAMKGADFGKKIYSMLRTATADFYGRYWANLDPHYKR